MATINGMEEAWHGHTGLEVETFIKSQFGGKAGYLHVDKNADGTANVLIGFPTEEEYQTWRDLSAEDRWGSVGTGLMVSWVVLPSVEQGDVYTITLILQSVPAELQRDSNVTVNVKAVETLTNNTGTSAYDETLTLQVQTRTSPTASWRLRKTLTMTSNSANYTDVNLADCLSPGANYVRIRAVGEYASSSWRSFTINVVNLSITPRMTTQIPFTSGVTLAYNIGGAVEKRLQLQLGRRVNGTFYADLTETASGCYIDMDARTYTETAFQYTPASGTDAYTYLNTPGKHSVRARLYVSETVYTDWVESEIMVNPSSEMVIVNSVNEELDNWSDVTFFTWSAYASSYPKTVVFQLVQQGTTNVVGEWTATAEANTLYTFSTSLGLTLDSSVTAFNAIMHIQDENGNTLGDDVYFTINNNNSFAPVEGADFILQPAGRSNTEANPKTIINEADGTVVESEWTGFDLVNDGYVEVAESEGSSKRVKALRIPAGRQVAISYNPFKNLMTSGSTSSMTIEVDFKCSNIIDEDEAILKVCSDYLSDVWGFQMKPLEAVMMTDNKRVRLDQNTTWAEGIRTRVTLNIVYDLYNGINYVRIFVNEKIEREFSYTTDIFINPSDATARKIVIGNTSSDIDIFGIRCYQKALSTSDVMRDYKSALATTAEKIAFDQFNDILGSDGKIDFNKAKNAGLNVIGHKNYNGATLPMYGNKVTNENNVDLEIYIHGDPAHSGVITSVGENKGQGTTAMGYYFWNQQYKFGSNTVFTNENGETFSGYPIQEGEALAKKLVGKINFASSMQGHKLGLTWAYTDVFKRLVSTGVMSEPGQITRQSSARLSVLEKPFLFFEWDDSQSKYVFRSLMTFGAGKGDKPTFGFDKNDTADMLMVEGADNDKPLALFAAPWDDTVGYNADDEYWYVNGQSGSKNINFGFGKTSGSPEVPSSENALTAVKNFFNFVYLHNSRIRYFDGTLAQLIAGASSAQQDDDSLGVPDNLRLYWLTTADSNAAKYDLVRWNGTTWAPAGLNGAVLNLRTQYESFCSDLGVSPSTFPSNNLACNDLIVQTRRSHFKLQADGYFHTDDAMYHYAFVKFFAATDNRAKNTYYYTDPVTLKIRWMQDDLDTVIKTNNLGQNRKPYYVEEHDKNTSGENYWQGENSGFYSLLEECYEDEIVAMTRNMLTAMAYLGGGTMDGFIKNYILSTQDYFPGIAYNENARCVYETASIAYNAGTYSGVADPLSQSCGSQRWSEYQWLTDRIMYISSWCEYGEFAGTNDASGSLQWEGANGNYAFTLTPAKWLYPRVGQGASNVYPRSGVKRVRVQAGETFNYQQFSNGSDSRISIKGINYYWEIGDMNVPVKAGNTFTFAGKRLRKITVNPDGTSANVFSAGGLAISSATNITEFVVRNVSTLEGTVNLSACTRLQKIDMRGSTPTTVSFPVCSSLVEIALPGSLTSLTLRGLSGLTTFSMESYANVTSVTVDVAGLDTYTIVSDIYNDRAPLSSISIHGVDWQYMSAELMMYVANIGNSDITGHIIVPSTTQTLSLMDVVKLSEKYGDIQNSSNSLYIEYTKTAITAIEMKCPIFYDEVKTYGAENFALTVTPAKGNNIRILNGIPQIRYYLYDASASTYAEITNEYSGEMNVKRLSSEAEDYRTRLCCELTTDTGTTLYKRKWIGFWRRIPKVGDFAYADGQFDEFLDTSRDVVGFVFKKDEIVSGQYRLRIYYKGVAITLKSLNSTYGNMSPQAYTFIKGSGNNQLTEAETNEVISITGKSYDDLIHITPYMGQNNSYYLRFANYCDDSTDDGFIVAPVIGDNFPNDWDGKSKTAAVVALANQVFISFGYDIPNDLYDLSDIVIANFQRFGRAANMQLAMLGLAYSASYCCYLFEPTVSGTLDGQYAKTSWYLPGIGEIARLTYYHTRSKQTTDTTPYPLGYPTIDGNDIDPETGKSVAQKDADKPIFSNLLYRSQEAGVSCPVAMMGSNTSNSQIMSSTEKSQNQMYIAQPSTNTNIWGGMYITYMQKDGQISYAKDVRPCCQYVWTLNN